MRWRQWLTMPGTNMGPCAATVTDAWEGRQIDKAGRQSDRQKEWMKEMGSRAGGGARTGWEGTTAEAKAEEVEAE